MEKYVCIQVILFFDFLHFIALYGTVILLSSGEWEKTEKCRENEVFLFIGDSML